MSDDVWANLLGLVVVAVLLVLAVVIARVHRRRTRERVEGFRKASDHHVRYMQGLYLERRDDWTPIPPENSDDTDEIPVVRPLVHGRSQSPAVPPGH